MSTSSPPEVKLSYDIAGATPHIGSFVPQNIMVDDPADQASRWGGTYQGHGRQWIILRLATVSVLKSITFGKLKSPHPCNMNEFKVLGSLTMDNWTELLQAHLENSPTPETFALRITNDEGLLLPIRYVKIIPLSAHGSAKTHSFHPSIWYVALSGIRDSTFMQRVVQRYEHFRETTTVKFILKYLRERRLLKSFDSVLDRTKITMEHPLISLLHTRLVLEGDFAACEALLHEIASAGLFSSFIRDARPKALWSRIVLAEGEQVPKPRGGHAMCIDTKNGRIYLHGGFDGKKSLDDFWVFDVETCKWRLLSPSTSMARNGPVARSCHKMVFDEKMECIYLLGKLGDDDKVPTRREETTPRVNSAISEEQPSLRSHRTSMSTSSQVQPASEFFRYHTRGIDSGKWDLLTFDTAGQGGPPLIYDHTMVIDSASQAIYVFGGRVLDGDMDPDKCSGLYSYTIATRKWRKLLMDSPTISPRFGHSMVFDTQKRQFLIFAGQQNEKYLADMHVFNLESATCQEVTNNFTLQGGPQRLFSQRAVIDSDAGEVYIFHGLTRPASKVAPSPALHEATTWMYCHASRQDKRWFQILPQRSSSDGQEEPEEDREPSPRYAHEVVYDGQRKAAWLFGGNAGNQDGSNPDKQIRLNDMWKMTLVKPSTEDLIRRATFTIRRQQFREMSEDQSAIDALRFLQDDVSNVVNHQDAEESSLFRSLLTHLLTAPSLEGEDPIVDEDEDSEEDENAVWTSTLPSLSNSTNGYPSSWVPPMDTPDDAERDLDRTVPLSGERFKQRHAVFESLLQYVTEESKQPEDDLLDVVDMFRSSRSIK